MTKEFYDNTMVQSHRGCARRFYFRHVRHWESTYPAVPLAFGLAWHDAMDVVWEGAKLDIPDNELVLKGYAKFTTTFETNGFSSDPSPDEQVLYGMRNCTTALEMLVHYVEQRRTWLRKVTVMHCELPFAVPLDPDNPDLFYVGRLDKVFEWNGRIYIGEHKTTSSYKKDGFFRNDFIESFSPNSQIDGYIHAGKMLFGKEFKGIMVDATLVHKTVHNGFMWIPVERSADMLQGWLYDTIEEIHSINRYSGHLKNCSEDDPTMLAYKKDTTTCANFFGRNCMYNDLCKGLANPMKLTEPPMGMQEKKWEPYNILRLEELFPEEAGHERVV